MKYNYRYDCFNLEALESVKHILSRPAYTWQEHELRIVLQLIEALETVCHHAPVDGKTPSTKAPQHLVTKNVFSYKKPKPFKQDQTLMYIALGVLIVLGFAGYLFKS